ncbi:hypothetical protein BH23GEM2_BH23GEM2_10320 [soil metagenome]
MVDAVSTGERDRILAGVARLRSEVARRIVGQERVIEEILLTLAAGGHVLLVGVPGLAGSSRRPIQLSLIPPVLAARLWCLMRAR